MGKPTISVACDRGNTGIKLVVSTEEKSLKPFKIPSVLMKVDGHGQSIKIKNESWLCGDDAMRVQRGDRHTPMEDRAAGKVSHLSVVVARAVHAMNKTGGDFYLNVAASTPFAGSGDALNKDIQKEIGKLGDGFSIGSTQYRPELGRVGCAHEGLILLETNPEYDGVIDMGYGTILGGYRKIDGSIQQVTTDRVGCVDALEAMRNDSRFAKAVQDAGFTSVPPLAKLSALLGSERWTVKNIDFRKFLDVSILQNSIADLMKSVLEGIARDDKWRDESPRIALIGGAACLLKGVLAEEKLDKWKTKIGIDIFSHAPDCQTALILAQLQKTNPDRFPKMGGSKNVK